jgi:hypothetical protein
MFCVRVIIQVSLRFAFGITKKKLYFQFAARVLEKLDFEEVYCLPFSEYLVDGEQVLKPVEPHVAAKILIKRV